LKPIAKGFLLTYVALFAGAVLFVMIGVPSKASRTSTTMTVLWRRIQAYASEHNALPSSLAELPVLKNRDDTIDDGWGREFLYSLSPEGIVNLTSHGRDGEPGGEDADRDFTEDLPVMANGAVVSLDDLYSLQIDRELRTLQPTDHKLVE